MMILRQGVKNNQVRGVPENKKTELWNMKGALCGTPTEVAASSLAA